MIDSAAVLVNMNDYRHTSKFYELNWGGWSGVDWEGDPVLFDKSVTAITAVTAISSVWSEIRYFWLGFEKKVQVRLDGVKK